MRPADPERVWRTFLVPVLSTDGYGVIWVHSSSKAVRDAAARSGRIPFEAGLAAIEALEARLSARSCLRTKLAAEQAAASVLSDPGTALGPRGHQRGERGERGELLPRTPATPGQLQALSPQGKGGPSCVGRGGRGDTRLRHAR